MDKAGFGSLGWKGTRIGLGTMPLAIQGRPGEHEAIQLIHRALDAGINWLDTADTYCLDDGDIGYGERLVAGALREWKGGDPEGIAVVTKGGWIRPGGEWVIDGHPARLKAACERSLIALGTSSIFIYLLHAPDPKVDFLDSVGALVDLQREGKIQHIGLSNVDVGHIKEAQRVAPIRLVQNRCNIFDQVSITNGVLKHCHDHNIAFVAHSPVGGHSGKARADTHPVLGSVARRRGLSPHQVALLWLLDRAKPAFAVPGARRLESLRSNLDALEISLAPNDLAELAAGFPAASLPRRAAVRIRNEVQRVRRSLRHRLHSLVE